jgi:flagella basal body P-ring formation protein FlgA
MNAARIGIALSLALLGCTWHATSMADSSLNGQIKAVAEAYLKARITDIPGKANILVAEPSRSSRLANCTSLEAFQPGGSKKLGATSVGVRCLAPASWSIYLSARVSLVTQYLAAAASLHPGQRVAAEDIVVKTGDIGNFPGDLVLSASQAVDHTLIFGVLAGTPLRMGMLRNPLVVQQGQSVRLLLDGKGFQVSAEAVALAGAADGQLVKTKTPSGQVVSGVAESGGTVRVTF